MGKLILQMTTLAGFVPPGPNDEQSWVTWDIQSVKPCVTRRGRFTVELC
jgi:hypothetical protein